MLNRLKVEGFKSLSEAEIKFPRMAVLFGPNAAGKSNLIDAIQALSRLGTEQTLTDALSAPVRGIPLEAFAFPSGGMEGLLKQRSAEFVLEAELAVGQEAYEYRVCVQIAPSSGVLTVGDERLVKLRLPSRKPWGVARIERVDDELHIRRAKRGRPNVEPIALNHTKLSDPRLTGSGYQPMERCRRELSGWRTYYLDPRVSMRREAPPKEVHDIGMLGEDIAPFLFRLANEKPKHFEAVKRTLRTLVPNVEQVSVDLDRRRGTLDIMVRQNDVDFSSRVMSEGTLRVLALCAIAVNPWGGSVLAFEEPENGVHPRRLELVAEVLTSLTLDRDRQLIVATHSPLFCDAILKRAKERPEDIGLFNVRRSGCQTEVTAFEATGPLFQSAEISEGLHAVNEDGVFESLIMRGLIDE